MKNIIVTASVAPLFPSASDKSPITDEILCGMTANVLDGENEYLYIETQYKYNGWIKKTDVVFGVYEDNFSLVPLEGFSVDILSAPSVKSAIIENLTAGCVVRLLGKGCKYNKVGLPDGREGFVNARFIAAPYFRPATEETVREVLVRAAESYLGAPYRWGGKTPRGIDCSGLCSIAYMKCGITIFRDAKIKDGFPIKEIPREALKKGDLIFFPGHVAMYLGGGKIIHSSETNGGVYVNSLNASDADFRADLAESVVCCGGYDFNEKEASL